MQNPISTVKRKQLEAIAQLFSIWTKKLTLSGSQLVSEIEDMNTPEIENLESFQELKKEIDDILEYIESGDSGKEQQQQK